ncbi:Peptidase M20 [Penicillium subrubescens]|uniref:Diaminopropionate ammonia-lyase n=1 Tax=Penicillium subrubescens TaxID=1316194 RepID=A0A1Q5UNY2_9EURO|nr:Peptidase M20 [Penicillium subrubescens]KAJ5905625.1 Peptidase M20 [Penicillium subrubescens]OKP14173.1 Diaminopropionate ammonia-lyase [Penicillium subrubescens]
MSSRRPIYINAAAVTKRCEDSQAAAVTKFHQSLPSYSPTPLVSFPELAAELGVRAVFVKDESNRFGLPSFKVLGASWGCFRAVAQQLGLPPTASLDEVSTGAKASVITLVAATEGNHGRAVAFMARLLGIDAQIFVPRSMDERTRGFIAGEGACVVVSPGCYDQAVFEASNRANKLPGALLIQDTAFEGYESVPAWIVEGYTTLMNEAEQQVAQLGLTTSVMVTPVGVGSLAHAVVRHCKSRKTPVSVVVVEPDSAPCLSKSLHAGKSITVETSFTIMDGMNCGTVSTTAWPDLQRLVDACVTVSSYESHEAVQFLTSKSVPAGPCGGASLAALRRLAAEPSASPLLHKDSVVVLLSTEGARKYSMPRDVSVEDVVGLTQVLTQINSSNPTLSVSDGVGESEIADYLSAWFSHRDIECHRVEPVAGRPSIVGILRGTGGGKSLMFNGHIDTVSLSSYEADPLSGALGVKDGQEVVFGRGSLDMKGGVAAALAALSSIKASGQIPRGDIIIAAVSDEEDASQGTQDILAAGWRADAAVVAEPTMKTIATAHKGFVWVEVDVLGVAAHGSDPSAGVDAILHAGWFLRALDQYQAKLPADDLLGQASMHCGLIRGGEEPSSYPGKCTVTVEFRTVPAQTEESILSDIIAMLQDITLENPHFQYAAPRVTMSRPTQKLAKDHPLVEKAVECGASIFGSKPVVQSVPFWCDAALLGQAEIPSIVFGPSGAGLHSKEEWVEVESLKEMEKVFTRLAQDFCN